MFTPRIHPSDDKFIEAIINTARASFIDGKANYEKTVKMMGIADEKIPGCKCIYDENFPTYHANKIHNTHSIACAGPKHNDAILFFKNIIFNEKVLVKEIVALGAYLGSKPTSHSQDFCSYMIKKNEGPIIYSHDCEEIKIQVTKQSGIVKTLPSGIFFPENIIQSEINVAYKDKTLINFLREENIKSVHRKINVTLIPLLDGDAINLTKMKVEQTKYLEILNILYQKYLKENIVVHCSSGFGRTGHFILMLELLKQWPDIISSKNPELIGEKIIKLLQDLRAQRPALVLSFRQLERAIRNADILYQYRLTLNAVSDLQKNPNLVRSKLSLFDKQSFDTMPKQTVLLEQSLLQENYFNKF